MQAYELLPRPSFDSLHLTDRPAPRPGAGEVLVRVRAASLNYRDLMVARAAESSGQRGRVPLSDGAGEIVEVGEGVTGLAAGDRVAGAFFPRWLDGPMRAEQHAAALGGSVDGVAAELVVLPAGAVVRVPGHLSFEEAATLPCAALTAWNALFVSGSVKPGDVVLVQGTGGVSIFALQLARAAGAEVIVTSGDETKLERARALGASHGINYRKTPEWGEAAFRLAGGRGVDQVLDVGGPGTLDQSLEAIRTGGLVSAIGVLTGVAGPVRTHRLLPKVATVRGIYVGSVAMFEAMNRALSRELLKPVVDRVFPFEELPQAYAHLASGAHFGKVVVRLPA